MDSLRILWIEDKYLDIKRFVELLRRKGADVQVAGSGEAALKMLQKARVEGEAYHAVLLDIMLPKGEGQRIADSVKDELMGEEVLRQMEGARIRTPVVGVTAVADDELYGRIRKEYDFVVDVLKKPIKMPELEEAISRAVARIEGNEEATP